jgi:hypothetical protein
MNTSLCLIFAAAATLAFADDSDDRSKLIGKWQEAAGSGAVWSLAGTQSELHVAEWRNGEKIADYKCNAMGRECKVKESGKDAVVSFWYNGSKLVQMETRGNEVTKRRFSPGGSDTIEIETIPIVPNGKPEVTKFKKVGDTPVEDARSDRH